MDKKLSDRKLAANRENAKRSTGPQTPGGKAASSQNARIHGLTALSMPLLERDRQRFRQLQHEFHDHFQPANAIEEDMVDRIIMARWHLSQAERLIQGYWDLAETPHLPEPKRLTERHRCRRLAQHLMKDCNGQNVLAKILRYKESARRDAVNYQKLLTQLREPTCETKPTQNPIDPLTNPFYRQDLYRILERRPKKLPSAYDDPSLRPNGSPAPPIAPLPTGKPQ